jgi:hypothetical protein
MRVWIRVVASIVAGLTVGCATHVDVAYDEGRDFSPYRTWSWLPGAACLVDAPLADGYALQARLARLVERGLDARGLQQSEEQADLVISVYLGIQRQLLIVNETGAVQSVHSLHSSPSFEVQATRRELRSYEHAHVVISVSDARELRPVWRGEFRGRFRGNFWPHLDEVVSELLQHLPRE